MILAMVDSSNRLRVYETGPGALQEIAGLQLKGTPEPSQLAAIVSALADMSEAPSSPNGHRKPRATRSDKGKPRKPPRDPRGARRSQLLALMEDGAWWTGTQLREALPAAKYSTITSTLSQWKAAGVVESRQGPSTGTRGRSPMEYRLNPKPQESLQA